MTKLKLGPLADDKPVKVSVELPAAVHRDLVAYAEVLGRTTGRPHPIRQNSSCRWSSASWRPTGHFQKPGDKLPLIRARVRPRDRGSAGAVATETALAVSRVGTPCSRTAQSPETNRHS
jgi:hypothetical protein